MNAFYCLRMPFTLFLRIRNLSQHRCLSSCLKSILFPAASLPNMMILITGVLFMKKIVLFTSKPALTWLNGKVAFCRNLRAIIFLGLLMYDLKAIIQLLLFRKFKGKVYMMLYPILTRL